MKITPETTIGDLRSYRQELSARWGPMSEDLYKSRPNPAAEAAYSDFESLVSAVDTLIQTVRKCANCGSDRVEVKEGIHGTSTHTIRELTEEEKVARRDAAQQPPADWVDNTPDGAPVVGDDSDSAFNANSLIATLDDHGRSFIADMKRNARGVLATLQSGNTPEAKHDLVHLVERVRPNLASFHVDELARNIYDEDHRHRVSSHPIRKTMLAVGRHIEDAHMFLQTGRVALAIQSLQSAKG